MKLSLGGDEVLVLHDAKDAEELVSLDDGKFCNMNSICHPQLNRRSSNYSSRKPLVYAAKYQSRNKRLVHLSYGDELRKQRAAFHSMLQPRGA